jgi:hypothetical protein
MVMVGRPTKYCDELLEAAGYVVRRDNAIKRGLWFG